MWSAKSEGLRRAQLPCLSLCLRCFNTKYSQRVLAVERLGGAEHVSGCLQSCWRRISSIHVDAHFDKVVVDES